MSDREKRIDVPLLQDHDPTIARDDNTNDEPIILPTRRDAFHPKMILFWICWTLLWYIFGLYCVEFVTDKTTRVVNSLLSTTSNAYDELGYTYKNIANPNAKMEVVQAMIEIYEVLADMGYYDYETIERAPHARGINHTLAVELGFSKRAIEMMDALPYLNMQRENPWLNDKNGEFLLYGTFADLRGDDGALEYSRNPMYVTSFEDGKPVKFRDHYMSPDHVILMFLGNHGAIMVLDVKKLTIYTVDQIDGNVDPATQHITIDCLACDPNSLENQPSRPAVQVLQDYIERFRSLKWMPGFENFGDVEGDWLAQLYKEHGWPDNFNRTAFLSARTAWKEAMFQEHYLGDYTSV